LTSTWTSTQDDVIGGDVEVDQLVDLDLDLRRAPRRRIVAPAARSTCNIDEEVDVQVAARPETGQVWVCTVRDRRAMSSSVPPGLCQEIWFLVH
jgi:hypothetical protein